jgi:hypothetical protein
VDNLALCVEEDEGSSIAIVCWKHFNMEKIVIKKSEEKKKLKFMHMETNSREFI